MTAKTERLLIAGPAGDLQTLVETPEEEPRYVAVICHPHPLFGGTLDNKVVYTVARAFRDAGAAAIRFNFRGVGSSSGIYDEGRGETEDALAVIDYARSRWSHAALWLAGFSFGGAVALRAAESAAPQLVVAVAPAVMRLERFDISAPQTRHCPWLIVQGDADEVLDAATVQSWAAKVSPLPAVHVMQGASHFFHGRLQELRDTVLAFARENSAPAGSLKK